MTSLTHSRPPAAVVSSSLPPARPSPGRALRRGPAAHPPVRRGPGWRPCPRPSATAGSPGARPGRMRGAPAVWLGSLRERGACAGPAGGTLTGPSRYPRMRAGFPPPIVVGTIPPHPHRPIPLMAAGGFSRPVSGAEGSGALLLLASLSDRAAAFTEASLARSGRAAPEEAAAARPPRPASRPQRARPRPWGDVK